MQLADFKKYEQLDLIARKLVEGFMVGLHKSPYRGFSVEFSEHRIYNPGESTRHIDWKIYAKTNRLYVKSYEEETNVRAYLVVDSSSSMYYPVAGFEKMRFAVYAAAALGTLLQKQRDGLGLVTFSSEIHLDIGAKSTLSHLQKILQALSQLLKKPPQPQQTRLAWICHRLAEKIPRRSMILLFSDLFQEEESMSDLLRGLQRLRHERHEVLIFHVKDKATETHLSFPERPYMFVPLEGGKALSLDIAEVRDIYTRQAKAWEDQLFTQCGELGIDFYSVDIQEHFEKILYACLMKRTKMP